VGVNDVDPVDAPPEMDDAERAQARAIAARFRHAAGRVSFASKELDDLMRRLGIDLVTAIGPNARDIRAVIEQARIASALVEPYPKAEDGVSWALVVYSTNGQVYQRELVALEPGDKVVPLGEAVEALKGLAR
jgi:hypothetical protein